MALPRAGPAEPGDAFAAKVLHLYQRIHRGASLDCVALRAPAEGVERHEPRAERGEPGEGFGVEARARVAGVADEREFFAENVVEQRAPPFIGAHEGLGDRPSLGPGPAPPRKAEIGAVRIGRRRLEATLPDMGVDAG